MKSVLYGAVLTDFTRARTSLVSRPLVVVYHFIGFEISGENVLFIEIQFPSESFCTCTNTIL